LDVPDLQPQLSQHLQRGKFNVSETQLNGRKISVVKTYSLAPPQAAWSQAALAKADVF